MQRLMERVRSQPERGASAVIVSLVLLVLVGFTGFGVDVTSAYAKSQEVQNAADAAAIATAQHCAQQEDPCTEGSQADPATGLAQKNVSTPLEERAAYDSYPAVDRVTVEVTAVHENFFAGAFGFQTFTVVREATATWDSPTRMTTFLPLTIGECEFNELLLDSETVVVINLTKTSNVECGTPTSGNAMPGGFGYIGTGECQDNVVDITENEGWVRMKTGGMPPDCDVSALENMVLSRTPILVPVFDACRMLPNPQPDVNRCQVAHSDANPLDGYRVKGFAAIELHGFKFSGTNNEMTYPRNGVDNINDYCVGGNERCIRGRFVEWVDLADASGWGEAPDYGVQSVRLIDPDYEAATP